MIKIVSHRGMWRGHCEKNTLVALESSFKSGFGVETDIRDFKGELVVSHDIATVSSPKLSKVVEMWKGYGCILALNIKSDGLSSRLEEMLAGTDSSRVFVFDMSTPEMRSYIKSTIPVYGRRSEVEKNTPWYDQWKGVWLDCFDTIWYDDFIIKENIAAGKNVCVVSRELHGFNPDEQWNFLYKIRNMEGLSICTDYPEKAAKFFGVKND